MSKEIIQEQFGAHAAHYITSRPHAHGGSLARLRELIPAEPDWQVLDVATGAGHTAYTFAPLVGHVWATDITPEMLAVTREGATERGLANLTVEQADAEALPYEDGRFHLVTCRIAAHHFVPVDPFVKEAARVLRPNGLLAVVDNVVPAGLTGDYLNAFEKFRDPSHGRCLTLAEWRTAFETAGLGIIHQETLDKQIAFDSWAKRHDPLMQRYLQAILLQAPPGAAAFLQPQTINGATTFRLQEGIFIGRRSARP